MMVFVKSVVMTRFAKHVNCVFSVKMSVLRSVPQSAMGMLKLLPM